MSLLVVGTIAYDSIETPAGRVHDELGGSATFFALAAARFAEVRLTGAVGEDFPMAKLHQVFEGRTVDFAGVDSVRGGRTFRWSGRYEGDMNSAQTLETQLNVLATFQPKLPGDYPKSPFVFLANTAPAVQLDVLRQVQAQGRKPFVVCDTMNFWIETQKDALLDVLRRVDGVILNDGEARQLTGERNLIKAGTKVLELGPKMAIVKKGEHGAFLFSTFLFHALPAYPVSEVVDPTGAGDCFAGGFMAALAEAGVGREAPDDAFRQAMLDGTATASFCPEGFSVEGLLRATDAAYAARRRQLQAMMTP